MHKMKWKKVTALILASVMILSMTACGKKGKSSSSKDSGDDKKDLTYAETDLDVGDVTGDLSGTFVVANGRIYFYTYVYEETDEDTSEDTSDETSEDASEDTSEDTSDETSEDASENTSEEATDETSEEVSEDTSEEVTDETSEDTSEDTTEDESTNSCYLYSMKTDGSDLQSLGSPKMSGSEYLYSMLVGSDGNLKLLYGSYDEDSGTSSYELVSVDENGNETDRKDISEALGISGEESYISKIMVDSKDRYIFATDQAIIALDQDGKKVAEVTPENNYVEALAKTKDGDVIYGDSSGDDGATIQVVDFDNEKLGEKKKLDMTYFSSSDALMDGFEGGDYDFYYKDSSAIYGYSLEDQKATALMDFVASNVNSDYSYSIVPIAKDQMLGVLFDDTGSRFVLYNKVDPDTIQEKTTITIGAMYIDSNIKSAAIEFNKKNTEYQIDIKDYSNEEDPETKMNTDIIAGNVPDIICLSGLPVEQYIEKGILEDLTGYYDKDEDVKLDDLIPSVRKAMETDGKVYYVAPTFYVSTLIGAAADVGTESGWTVSDMKKVLEEKSGSRPFYATNKSDILSSLMGYSAGDYVDWSTGECTFDSQDFKDILEISNTGENKESSYDESMPELIQSGKVLLVDSSGGNPEDAEMYEKMFNQDITYIGYPTADKNGSYFYFDGQMGIYSKSDVKDAAWEFLKSFMTLEYQGKESNVYMNPTRQDAFDMMMKRKTATEKYTDELGTEIEPLESSYGWDDLEVEIGPMSEEQAQQYIDLVNSTTKTRSYNTEIQEIITEEAQAYFDGTKSLDETVDIIQNRVKTYVNENR